MINLNYLEKKLSKFFGRKFCVITGNGTTAMYLYFRLFKKRSTILFPSITCVQAVNSALFANQKVLFSDVSLKDYNINFHDFIKVEKKNKIDVVVPTHIFGHTTNIKKITNYCKRKNINILEDATQAVGATFYGKKTGSFGNASVISFGYSKILDCGGGGAILTDEEHTYKKIKRMLNILPIKNKKNFVKFTEYKNYYYNLKKTNQTKKTFIKKIFTYQKKIKKYLLFKIDQKTINNINDKFKNIKIILSKRKINHKIYDKYLNKKNIVLPRFYKGSVSWRYCFLLKKKRDKFVDFLRSRNIDVSTWYPSLHYLTNQKDKNFKNSKKIDNSIINLWTNENKSISDIKKNILIINNFLNS